MIRTISNQRFLASIDPAHGANCIQLRELEHGITVLREPKNRLFPDDPYLYGMPILFPPNRIADGCFDFDGRVYRYPINEESTNCHCHGSLCRAAFQVIEQKPDEILCAFYAKEGELYPGFPHALKVIIRYRLTEDGMEQTVTVANHSQTRMPVMLGFHTTFPIPFMAGQNPEDVWIQADVGEEIRRDPVRHLPVGKLLQADETTRQLNTGTFRPAVQDISRHYRATKPGMMRLIDKKNGITICYENSENMPYRLLLTNGAQGYACLEPQTCMVDCANGPFDRETAGFSWIEPQNCADYSSRIGVIVNNRGVLK